MKTLAIRLAEGRWLDFVKRMETTDADPVVIQAVMLSDQVIREAGTNKLTLIGIFSAWNCPNFPFVTAPFWVTAFLTNFRAGTKESNLVVRIEQKRTGMVFGSGAARVQFAEGKITPELMVEIPYRMLGVMLPEPGPYRIVLLANDEKIAERPVIVFPTNMPLNPPTSE